MDGKEHFGPDRLLLENEVELLFSSQKKQDKKKHETLGDLCICTHVHDCMFLCFCVIAGQELLHGNHLIKEHMHVS